MVTMPNPVGYSRLPRPLQGLALCDLNVSAAEPAVNVPANKFYYAAPIGGPWVTPPYSDDPMDAIAVGGAPGPPYDPIPMNNVKGTSGTSNIAADACADTDCTYVEIELSIAVAGPPGFIHFDSDTLDVSVLNAFGVAMTGFGGLAYQGDTWDISDNADFGVANEAIVTPAPTFAATAQYNVVSQLLRPTALTWAGQDPDNFANRNIWRASEVGAITWTTFVYSSTIEVNCSMTIRGFALSTNYPSACPINPSEPTDEVLMLVV